MTKRALLWITPTAWRTKMLRVWQTFSRRSSVSFLQRSAATACMTAITRPQKVWRKTWSSSCGMKLFNEIMVEQFKARTAKECIANILKNPDAVYSLIALPSWQKFPYCTGPLKVQTWRVKCSMRAQEMTSRRKFQVSYYFHSYIMEISTQVLNSNIFFLAQVWSLSGKLMILQTYTSLVSWRNSVVR